MSYKKYFATVVISIALLLCLIWGALIVLPEECYMDGQYPSHMYQKNYIHEDGDREEILFLGDSQMQCGVIPSAIGKNAVNLALGGATPMMMHHTLKVYLEHHPKPKHVIIGFGSGHYTSMGHFYKRICYFHYLSYAEEEALLKSILRYNKVGFVGKLKLWFKVGQYRMRSPFVYLNALVKSRLGRREENRKKYKRQQIECGQDDYGKGSFYDKAALMDYDFMPMPLMDYHIREMIRLCNRNNINVSIVQLPINPANYEKNMVNGRYFKSFIDYMNRLKNEERCDVQIEMPVYPADCFADASHLNKKGQERFSKEMLKKLESFNTGYNTEIPLHSIKTR